MSPHLPSLRVSPRSHRAPPPTRPPPRALRPRPATRLRCHTPHHLRHLPSARSCQYLAAIAAIDLLYNVVDSPVGTLPVTRVHPTLDRLRAEWSDPRVGRGHGSPLVERLLYGTPDAPGGFYDADKMAGIPVGVQVVGRRWEEEKVVEMMKVVDAALGPRDVGQPLSWAGQGK